MSDDRGRTGSDVFVDESKVRDYLLVAVVVLSGGIADARSTVRKLTPAGQPRLHMTKESDPRRRQILSALTELDFHVRIYRAEKRNRTELLRRELCLRALVADLSVAGHSRLCLERDDTLVSRDRQQIIDAARLAGTTQTLAYRHESATSEPLLAIPDALAWAWAKGGDWRRRCPKQAVVVIEV